MDRYQFLSTMSSAYDVHIVLHLIINLWFKIYYFLD